MKIQTSKGPVLLLVLLLLGTYGCDAQGNATTGHIDDIIRGLQPRVPLINSGLRAALNQGNALSSISFDIVTQLTAVLKALAKVAVPEAVGPDPDVEAKRFGLIGNKYTVTTKDGYKLTAFRVRSKCTDPKRVVVIPQGVLANAAEFIMLQEKSLVYKLARQCSDVWLISFRGGRYGRGHTKLSDKSNKFWDFEPLEWGKYDLPANLEFISKVTGSRKIRLVGVDIAGTALFIMASEYGARYQQLLGRTYLIGPIAYLTHLRPPAIATITLMRILLTNLGAVTPTNELPFWKPSFHGAFYLLCTKLSPQTCNYLFQLLVGPTDEVSMDFSNIAKYVLDSMSTKSLSYFFQLFGKDKYFSKYDYGTAENLKRYGTAAPPAYNLGAVRVPCNFYVLGKDTAATPEDVTATFAALPRSVQQRINTVPTFNAVSPSQGVHPELLYAPLAQHIEQDFVADGLPACKAACKK